MPETRMPYTPRPRPEVTKRTDESCVLLQDRANLGNNRFNLVHTFGNNLNYI